MIFDLEKAKIWSYIERIAISLLVIQAKVDNSKYYIKKKFT